jgi:hypothetical protein
VLSQIARAAVALAAGGGLSMTLAACYGAPCTAGVDNDGDGAIVGGGCGLGFQQDCNDSDVGIRPGADDPVGDGIDQNCDGVDGTVGETACQPDAVDADGDGAAPTGRGCLPSELDCDDADGAVGPLAGDTIGDGIDTNCDGVDGWCASGVIDADADGAFADGTCAVDCDDANPDVNPRVFDEPGDQLDANCDGVDGTQGVTICDEAGADADGDGFIVSESQACTAAEIDCDDAEPRAHPGALDNAGDGIDANCDGVDGVAGCTAGVTDGDGDGYVSDGTCIPLDCNDGQAAIHPYATDDLGDTFDQDCDGVDG